MNMKYRVNVVVVTCNRCELLKKSIESLENQTYKINNIIIINNASNDGTKEFLESIKSTNICVEHRERNEGGAGGFYWGIQEAYSMGCDFVWIMDDDTICKPDSLEKLLTDYEILQNRNVGFLASNVLYKDGSPCLMNICKPDFVWNEFAEYGIVKVTHCSFVAMLIPSWVIKDVGLPIREYFIWGDDGEYSTRILRKYEGFLSANSKVFHYMNANVGVDIWNIEKKRINRFFYFYRNWMCTNRMRGRLEGKRFEAEAKALVAAIRKSNTCDKSEKIRAIRDGVKAGKKFDVSIEFPDGRKVVENTINDDMGLSVWKTNHLLMFFRKILIKRDIKTNGSVTFCKKLYLKYQRESESKIDRFLFLIKGLVRTRLFCSGCKVDDLRHLLENCKIDTSGNELFVYSIDEYRSWKVDKRQIGNCTIDYELVVNHSLEELLFANPKTDYENDSNAVINSLIHYVNREIDCIRKSSHANKYRIIEHLSRLIDARAESLEEALQRILFINQVFWQTNHIQMGLGRLDKVLSRFDNSSISDADIEELLTDFFRLLHKKYWLKSEEMLGDTGQIVVIGGVDEKGENVCNRITFAILRVIKKLQIPDPKVLLRVEKGTSDELLELAIDCISTGIGSPLLANDEVIIPYLTNFGYDLPDSRDYITSACWEIIPGNSCEQNNISVFDWSIPFELVRRKENLEELDTFDKFIWKYSEHLCGHVYFMSHLTDSIEWEYDPLLSCFMKSCREKKLDITNGGAKYSNYGMLSVGLANAVNSLINIRKYVYEQKLFSLHDLFLMRDHNYSGFDEVFSLLAYSKKYFGTDNFEEDAIGLTNWLIGRVNDVLDGFENKYGGRMKFGLSSPGYIIMGKENKATFDGRKDYEPYAIHISGDENDDILGLFNFASGLLLGRHGFNGNVVDFSLQSSFVEDNSVKLVELIKGAMKAGFFETQINILDYKKLIEARDNPKKYPNLIVRVWGFSAYFKDLPMEYQNYVIERARKKETINN